MTGKQLIIHDIFYGLSCVIRELASLIEHGDYGIDNDCNTEAALDKFNKIMEQHIEYLEQRGKSGFRPEEKKP